MRLWLCVFLTFSFFSFSLSAGTLIPRGATQENDITEIEHKVIVTIKEQIAITKVSQVFFNNTSRSLEAIYRFSLPQGAQIHRLAMWIGTQKMYGAILTKHRSRNIYNSIVRSKRDPALLEEIAPGRFQLSIFPVLAKKQQRIELIYGQILPRIDNTISYHYPLRGEKVFGNYYRSKVKNFSLHASLTSNNPIVKTTCSNDLAYINGRGNDLIFNASNFVPKKDFHFSYGIREKLAPLKVVCHRPDIYKPGYFLAFLSPQDISSKKKRASTFVLDISGSMHGQKRAKARKLLDTWINNLGAEDLFNVVIFGSKARKLSKNLLFASAVNKEKAKKFYHTSSKEATNLCSALKKAIIKTKLFHSIVIVTDGFPTKGKTSEKEILADISCPISTQVSVVSVGDAFASQFLQNLALHCKGFYSHISKIKNSKVFLANITYPYLSHGEIHLAKSHEIFPQGKIHLFAGRQTIVCGRYQNTGTFPIKLTGYRQGQKANISYHANFINTDHNSYVGALWAGAKIKHLLAQKKQQEAVVLAKKWGMVTPHTSFLVLETKRDYKRWGVTQFKQNKFCFESLDGDVYKPKKTLKNIVVKTRDSRDHVARKRKRKSANAHTEEFAMSKGFQEPNEYEKGKIAVKIGGKFGTRFGGRSNLLKRGGGSMLTEDAVRAGLKWLVRHQSPNGSWDGDGYLEQCNSNRMGVCKGQGAHWLDVGLTGLSLLCFTTAGNTTTVGEFRDVVKKAARFLIKSQNSEGNFGNKSGIYLYNHAIATLAIAKSYGLSNHNPIFRTATEKAVKYLISAQSPKGGWGYFYKDKNPNTFVTTWAVLALKSALVAEIKVAKAVLAKTLKWIESMTDIHYYRTGYTRSGDSGWGKNYGVETMTAAAMLSRVCLGQWRSSEKLIGGAGLLSASLPKWSVDSSGKNTTDFIYWFFGARAMYKIGGDHWKNWNDKIKQALLNKQHRNNCLDGSWDPVDYWGSKVGGRVYATAINILTLETYYAYTNYSYKRRNSFGGRF